MKSSTIVISALLSVATAIRLSDDDQLALSQSLLNSNSDIGMEGTKDSSDNQYDKEIKTSFAQIDRDIIDENGDGVEDNTKKNQDELDRFRKKVFGNGFEDMHNTHNGEYPGHDRAGDSPMPILAPSAAQVKSVSDEAAKSLDNKLASAQNVELNVDQLSDIATPLDYVSDSDAEYVQMTTTVNNRFSFYINNIQSPEDLDFLGLETTKTRKAWKRRITDADGDGIEDNIKFSHDELDEFYDPLVFGVAEDINNTRHGGLPGHRQLEFTL